jgi:hypothetical protein
MIIWQVCQIRADAQCRSRSLQRRISFSTVGIFKAPLIFGPIIRSEIKIEAVKLPVKGKAMLDLLTLPELWSTLQNLYGIQARFENNPINDPDHKVARIKISNQIARVCAEITKRKANGN